LHALPGDQAPQEEGRVMSDPVELTEEEAIDRAERLQACCYALALLHVSDPAPHGVWAAEVVDTLGGDPAVVARARKIAKQEGPRIVRVKH
jgi:hypothetical protein